MTNPSGVSEGYFPVRLSEVSLSEQVTVTHVVEYSQKLKY